MRHYIDEQLEARFNEVKSYILDIKDFTHEALVEEYIKQVKIGYPLHKYTYDMIQNYYKYLMPLTDIDLITKSVEEKFYIFDDEEEHPYNINIVDNIINGLHVYNRWTNEEY